MSKKTLEDKAVETIEKVEAAVENADTSALEGKAVALLDKAEIGLANLTKALAEIGEKYGSDVVDAGLNIARITAGQSILYGIFCLVIAIICGRIVKKWVNIMTEERYKNNPPDRYILGTIFAGFGLATSGIAAVVLLIDIWGWVGLVEPKLWIAHKIIGW